jgi:hypothetical protein
MKQPDFSTLNNYARQYSFALHNPIDRAVQPDRRLMREVYYVVDGGAFWKSSIHGFFLLEERRMEVAALGPAFPLSANAASPPPKVSLHQSHNFCRDPAVISKTA